MNLYDTLDIPKDATENEIKRAYKYAAQKNHPDKGGDVKKFIAVNEAYKILSSEDKRKRYDATGDIKQTEMSNDEKASKELANMFLAVLDKYRDVSTVDIVSELKQIAWQILNQNTVNLQNTQERSKKLRMSKKRIIKWDNKDFLLANIDDRRRFAIHEIKQINNNIKIIKIIIQKLDECEYVFNPTRVQQYNSQWSVI